MVLTCLFPGGKLSSFTGMVQAKPVWILAGVGGSFVSEWSPLHWPGDTEFCSLMGRKDTSGDSAALGQQK